MKRNFTRVVRAATVAGLLTGATAGAAMLRPLAVAGVSAPAAARPHLLGASSAAPGDPARNHMAKLDSTLFAIWKAMPTLAPETALDTLRVVSPNAHFRTLVPQRLPSVMIDAVADADVEALRAKLLNLGLANASVFSNDIGGWLPVDQLEALAALPELRLARVSARGRVRATGAVTSQGDFAQRSDVLRAMSSTFDGRGVTVGVLSDSLNCYNYYEQHGYQASGPDGYASNGFEIDLAKDVASGDITPFVNVLEDADCTDYDPTSQLPYSDEGRAVLQIVHDVAPGASLAFYTADVSEADFANGIVALANAGAKVIDDDIGYLDEPIFQDGLLAQAVNQVQARGVTYFSSAGNDGHNSYENTKPSFPVATASGAANAGEYLLNFDPSGQTTTTELPITIPALVPGQFVYFAVQWDQPYVTGAPGSPGAANALDICLTDGAGNVLECSGPNDIGGDPVVLTAVYNPATANGNTAASPAGIEIGLVSGQAPGLVKFLLLDDGATINAFQTNSPTLQGHPGAAGAAAVGAAAYYQTPRCGTSPAVLEPFSSRGGDPILFDTSGNRLATPVVRQKPDFVDADTVDTTFFGDSLPALNTSIVQCQNNTNYPSFTGTSAAAPHAAAVAALFLQANPALTPGQIVSALTATAAPMGAASESYDYGSGFVQADAAFTRLGLTAPGASTTPTPAPAPTFTPTVGAKSGGGGAFGWPALGVLCLLIPWARRRTGNDRRTLI